MALGSLSQAQVPTTLPAKTKPTRVNLSASSAIRINYGNPSWNRSPESIDSATVIMREGVSGRIVQVQLNETAPDSSIFQGRYSINWQHMEQLQTEFYIPSQQQLAEKDGLMKIIAKINAHEIPRNPFIMRRLPNGEQAIEIFDTRDQARAAMRAYRAEQLVLLQSQNLQNQKPTKFPSDQDLDAEKIAAQQKLREEAARAVSERARLEQLEAKRLGDMIAQREALHAAERERRRQQGLQLGRQGMELYKKEDFAGAKAKFDQAIALDPDNRLFYFQYGVTLYKLGEYNRSLVLLNMATGKDVNPTEKSYFLALNHLKMKEIDAALKSFDDAIASGDPVIAPSSQFYKGVLLYEHEDYDGAQKAFQAVLDSSQDPLLDERAEAYVEQILRARQMAEERKRKWTISASIGEMYDSNILLSKDSQRDAGLATDSAGWRTLLSGSARFRPVYDETKEFAAQLDLVTLYTVDKTFQIDQSLRDADPTVATLTLPWTQKGMWFGKGHKLDITPGYETTIMSIDNHETKPILNSYLLSLSNLLVMNEMWFSTALLDVRSDNSNLTTASADDNATALKLRLSVSNLVFMNDKKDRILIPEGALTLNQAQGKNAVYDRADLGLGYLIPWRWDTTANFKLGYFYLDYPTKSPAVRTDHSFTATAGLSKKISEVWNSGVLGSYNVNRSNEDVNTYNKFTLMVTLSAAYGL